ncbi:MAG: HlyD family type I secretion periplasmic adaptor subunit [Alphaproteobacteria bacterium]
MAQFTLDMSPEQAPPPAKPSGMARGPITFGLIIFGLFFLGFGGWSVASSLTDGAIAPGQVVTKRHVVQHREGGNVLKVHFKEGDHVKAGDLLVTLGDLNVLANFRATQHQLWSRTAARARMLAQLGKKDVIDWGPELERNRGNPIVEEAIANEAAIFTSFAERFESQVEVMEQRKSQARKQIDGLEEQINAASRSIRLIDQEINGVEKLVIKGLERQSRLLALKRQREQLYSSRGANRAGVQQTLDRISELDATLLNLENDELSQVAQQLSQVVVEIEELRQRKTALTDQAQRLEIRAEVGGRLLNKQPNIGEGGVVSPGNPIVEIVPQGEELLIEARVSPIDKDSVPASKEGIMEAEIMFSGFPAKDAPRMKGTLVSVSSDQLIDPATSMPYFLARIRINEGEIEREGIELEPGMPAEVVLITGESSFFEKLAKPLLQSLDSSFKSG